MSELRVGYVPLTDAAVLIAAAELGFARRRGVSLVLEREPSWATLRDKLVLGIVDAAHLLAPLAIATALGLPPGPGVDLVAPFALNLNGNAVTVSTALWAEIDAEGAGASVADLAAALGRVARARTARGRASLLFATVFPFSTHTYQLRALFRLAGLDPDRDLALTVVPPPYMAEALGGGAVDGFCVGSPWNSVAVAAGTGRIAALGVALTPDAPEKVLAWPRGRVAPELAAEIVASLVEAAAWCADPAHRAELARLLGGPRHLDLPADLVARALAGRLAADGAGTILSHPGHLRLGGAVHRPDPAHAGWLFDRMEEAGQATPPPGTSRSGMRARALAVYDPAAYEAGEALARLPA